jgi:alpha-N-arabinofuranosidase
LKSAGLRPPYHGKLTLPFMKAPLLSALALASLSLASQAAEPLSLTVQVDKPGAKINPAMWGVFFEDINFGADGGLYAELVKNRSFEFPDPLMGWKKLPGASKAEVLDAEPLNAKNPHYLRLEVGGLSNEGFRGIGLHAGETYEFSAKARVASGSPALAVELVSNGGTVLANARVKPTSGDWAEVTATLKPRKTEEKARLVVRLEGSGAIDLDMVSLFPQKTWKERPRGLRADMVQKLADLRPGFIRFPGGCIVEGQTLPLRYQWKKTVGPVEERESLINRWNNEFKQRLTPDYFQSFGLGFFEYFQLCEDIGAKPLPILNCGLACQFNSGEACPLDQLDTYIQDAIDLIEFANGPADSKWGSVRAAMGHPEPFHLEMIGIGNENWDQPYIERYAKFHEVLKAKHPEITLVSSSGPAPEDKRFHFAWEKLRELKTDIIDEHCYAKPDWFFNNAHRYDTYDRNGPKVFMGEYAAHSGTKPDNRRRNDLLSALAEAAFMTGLERNADIVRLASYAPLFAHIDAWQWTPDMIWVNNLASYGTPNYYVQGLFSRNRGDVVLPTKLTLPDKGLRVYASAVRDETTGEIILKLVNGTADSRTLRIDLAGATGLGRIARAMVLTGDSLETENSFEKPLAVAPQEKNISIAGPQFSTPLAAHSLTVMRIPAAK